MLKIALGAEINNFTLNNIYNIIIKMGASGKRQNKHIQWQKMYRKLAKVQATFSMYTCTCSIQPTMDDQTTCTVYIL